MKKITKYTLVASIPIVGICVPTVVILEIVRNGNWWALVYLPWAIGIMIFALSLLGRGSKDKEAA